MAENFGIEGRGKFYDGVGATRDVLQNHILQVLTMLTMEPPISISSEDMQNEKIKVLSAIRDIKADDVIRGQYVGYLDEEGVAANSDTETFVAMKVFIDNWRWAGVPIYMRTGKKMPETVLEVLVEFKKPPRELFGRGNPNAVRFRLGAKDGVDISLLAKKPGTKLTTEEIDLTVEFVTEFGDRQGPYERLLRAAMLGDHFRFTRIDAVLHSWKILEDILKSPTRVHPYFEGTWGPDEAQEMMPGGWNPVGTQVDV
jgi:glucose-6-phosphate 1-dehydrogenase